MEGQCRGNGGRMRGDPVPLDEQVHHGGAGQGIRKEGIKVPCRPQCHDKRCLQLAHHWLSAGAVQTTKRDGHDRLKSGTGGAGIIKVGGRGMQRSRGRLPGFSRSLASATGQLEGALLEFVLADKTGRVDTVAACALAKGGRVVWSRG